MRNRLLVVLALLLAWGAGGAIVNIAVAWGTALRLPAPLESDVTLMVSLEPGRLMMQQRPGDTRITIHGSGKAPSIGHVREIDGASLRPLLPGGSVFGDLTWVDDQLNAARPESGSAVLIEHTHGWPVLAMSGWMITAFPAGGAPEIVRQQALHEIGPVNLWLFSTSASYRRLLPLRPIWPGFAINTAFYAAILWALFVVPFALRRWRRIKRGLCPACAYPVGDSPVCTECGASFPPPLRAGVRGRVEDTSSKDAAWATHPPCPLPQGRGE